VSILYLLFFDCFFEYFFFNLYYLFYLKWITTALLVLFMHRSPIGTLFPLDLEIKATLRRNRAERRRKLLQDRTVASILEEETHFSDSLSPDSPLRTIQVALYHNFSLALHVLKCKRTTSPTHIL